MTGGWHIAQVNIALPREPLDSPALAFCVGERIDRFEAAPGSPSAAHVIDDREPCPAG